MTCNCHVKDKYELNERELRIVELLRVLDEQDPVMKYMPDSIIDILEILSKRGSDYNGNVSGVYEQVYQLKDMSAFVHTMRPMLRAKQILSSNGIKAPEDKIGDKINDAPGYALLWKCCRKYEANEGA